MRYIILTLICISMALPAIPQRNGRYRQSRHSSGGRNVQSYALSNRIFLKWTPSALIRLPESVLRIGGEYCFAQRFGIEVQGGPVFGGRRDRANRAKATGGWEARVEPRVYFGMGPKGRWVTGLQGLYRVQNYDGGLATAYDKHGDITNFSQDAAQTTAMGFGAYVGYMFSLGSGLHLEISTGLASKHVHIERVNLQNATPPQGTSLMFLTEPEVLSEADLPYCIIQLKFAGMLGGDRN